MIPLRDYQTAIIDKLRAAFVGGARRPLLSLPTGAGKTRVALAVAEAALSRGKRVGVLVERIVLADQWKAAAADLGLAAGIVQASRDQRDHSLTIYSQQTVESRSVKDATNSGDGLRRWPSEDVVFIDEAHCDRRMVRDWIRDTANRPKNQLIVGVTATPHKAGLGDTYDKLVSGPSTKALTEAGWLIPAEWHVGKAFIDMEGARVNKATGEYYESEVDDRAMVVIGDVAQEWFDFVMELGEGELLPTVAYSATVKAGEKLVEEVNERFGGGSYEVARQVSYKDTTEWREETLKMFRDGDLPMIVNVGVLVRGWDAPNARVLADISPFRANLGGYAQIIGRVLRPSEGRAQDGEKAVVLDFCQNISRLHAEWLDFYENGVRTLAPDPPEPGTWIRIWHCHEPVELEDPCPVCAAERPEGREVFMRWRCGECRKINHPQDAICDAAHCEAKRPPAPSGQNDQPKGWKCMACSALNDPGDDACSACGEPRPKHYEELDGTLERYDFDGGAAFGVDDGMDLSKPSEYAWRHLFEVSLRRIVKKGRVTPVRMEKAKKCALAQFRDAFGCWPRKTWRSVPPREPRIDPRIEAWAARKLNEWKERQGWR